MALRMERRLEWPSEETVTGPAPYISDLLGPCTSAVGPPDLNFGTVEKRGGTGLALAAVITHRLGQSSCVPKGGGGAGGSVDGGQDGGDGRGGRPGVGCAGVRMGEARRGGGGGGRRGRGGGGGGPEGVARCVVPGGGRGAWRGFWAVWG